VLFPYATPRSYVSLRSFLDGGIPGNPVGIKPIKIVEGSREALIEAAYDEAWRAAYDKRKVVFAPPVATFSNRKHAREQDIVDGLDICAELDAQPKQGLTTLEELLGPATIVIASGGTWRDPKTGKLEPKLHAHWRLNKPAQGKDRKRLKEAREFAIDLVGGDPTHKSIVHPIRWSGSWHRKGNPVLCNIVRVDANREIDLTEALEVLRKAKGNSRAHNLKNHGEQFKPPINIKRALAKMEYKPEDTTEDGNSIHWTQLRCSAALLQKGNDIDAVVECILEATRKAADRAGEHDWDWEGEEATIRGMCTDWLEKHPQEDELEEEDDDEEDDVESENLFDPWAQFVVPDFPLDVLPSEVQEYVVAQAAVIGCDISTMAMAVMCAFSGALDHRFNLKMMRTGTWYPRPRLWVLLYGDSSKKKTPAIDAATQPLEEHQKEVWQRYKDECRIAAESEDKEKIDPPARFVVYDTTIEKLGEILARSGSGVLVKRDEFAGWIGSMEKYGGSSRGASANRAFWLQAYDGGPYIVDRIGRGEILVENLSTSLIGGIQPKRLSELHGLTSDGLLQRFLPVVMGASTLALDKPCDTEAYAALVKQLLDAVPDFLTLSDAALQVMNDLRLHLHNIEQHSGGMAEGFQAFVGKLPGVAGSLALILHMVADPKNGSRKEVGRETVEGVRRLIVDFILPHALEFYRTAESSTNGDRLKKLASWILTNGQSRFVASDLTSNVADFRGLSLFEVNERVSPLEAAGWIRPTERGGISRAWKVNPAVFTKFTARARDEEARKGELTKLMGAYRREK
jgi:hypothetical protein